MKPAHGFYDVIINDQKIDPSEMLFIDDIAENVNAAKNAGMQAVKFENPGQLKDILKTLGVLL
jgi:HAD superfamily hydrolase (TIGR01509 family)